MWGNDKYQWLIIIGLAGGGKAIIHGYEALSQSHAVNFTQASAAIDFHNLVRPLPKMCDIYILNIRIVMLSASWFPLIVTEKKYS